MPTKINVEYKITDKLASMLIKLEGIKERMKMRRIPAATVEQWRESLQIAQAHYSCKMEGNTISLKDAETALLQEPPAMPGAQAVMPGAQAVMPEVPAGESGSRPAGGQAELKTCRDAVALLDKAAREPLTPLAINDFYTCLTGRISVYRNDQNALSDAATGQILYMPPDAADIPQLLQALTDWINDADASVPCVLRAAAAHYKFATIYPYPDANGKVARLLAALVLRKGGYEPFFAPEEYYARDPRKYTEALTGNYYMGQAGSDITQWAEYFSAALLDAMQKSEAQAAKIQPVREEKPAYKLRDLDARRRKAIALFEKHSVVTSGDLTKLFSLAPRTARQLLGKWVKSGFIKVADPSKKARKYKLSSKYC